MKIITQPESHEYRGVCRHCTSEIEAARYELYDFDGNDNSAMGKCPVCRGNIIFKLK